MFSDFRVYVKDTLNKRHWNYANLCEVTKLKENTIKCFMCGATDSRRVAEKIADALGCKLIYTDGTYSVEN